MLSPDASSRYFFGFRSDQLEVGDYIVSVNGLRTTQLRYDQVANLLRNAGDEVVLEVEYALPEPREFPKNFPLQVATFSKLAPPSALMKPGMN